LTGNLILLKKEFKSTIGLFSFYHLKDFDFDFNKTSYNQMPEWELYKYFYIPPDTDLIQNDVWYKVVGNGVIEYNNIKYYSTNIDNINIFKGISDITKYKLIEGDAYIIYAKNDILGNNINDIALYDGDGDVNRFNGYFTIRDSFIEKEPSKDFDTRDVFYNNMLSSEYHYYRENFITELALDSRLVPYITKWGYVDGMNARDVQYRLNNHISFGFNNFAPDHFEMAQNPLNMTHEWYYLTSDYNFIKETKINSKNYCYFKNNLDLDLNSELFTNDNMFNDYFTYAYIENNIQLAKTQKKIFIYQI
jgi:hypothetical protein